MSYRVSTQVYSGPFDLLLQLVTRQKVDIGAISISEVAEQYLAEAERILRSTAASSADCVSALRPAEPYTRSLDAAPSSASAMHSSRPP